MNEYGSFAKEAANLLDVNIHTLRRWCLELEKNGYQFERNEKDQRIFYKRDIIALRQLQSLINDKVPSTNAFKTVATSHINKKELEQTLSVYGENSVQTPVNDDLIEQLLERVDKQEQFNKELLDRLDQQQKFINERLNAQEERLIKRDETLMQSIREFQEQKLLEIAAAKEEEKKGFWSRLLGR